MAKRAHRTLSLEKLKILDAIGSKTYKAIGEQYGVGVSTVADIKRKGQQLREHKRKLTDGMHKTSKDNEDWLWPGTRDGWFRQKREEGVPITGNANHVASYAKLIAAIVIHRPCSPSQSCTTCFHYPSGRNASPIGCTIFHPKTKAHCRCNVVGAPTSPSMATLPPPCGP